MFGPLSTPRFGVRCVTHDPPGALGVSPKVTGAPLRDVEPVMEVSLLLLIVPHSVVAGHLKHPGWYRAKPDIDLLDARPSLGQSNMLLDENPIGTTSRS